MWANNGPHTWSSSEFSLASWKNLDKNAAFTTVGAFLGTDLPSVPTAVANSFCANPISGTWQIAHDIVSVCESLLSKNNFLPSSIFSGVRFVPSGNLSFGNPSCCVIAIVYKSAGFPVLCRLLLALS